MDQIFLRICALKLGVHRAHNPPCHRCQVRRKRHRHRFAGDLTQGLLDLGDMLMLVDFIHFHIFIDFRVMVRQVHAPARAGHARLGVDDDAGRIDPACAQCRDQAEQGSGWIAARVGDELLAFDFVAVDFG
ncbi:hypothetical protein D3C76_1347250 [compost metagenome]